MPDPQGLIEFPGISTDDILRGSMTLSHGITPSVAIIETVPQSGFVPSKGTLKFTFAQVTIEFPDSIINQPSVLHSTDTGSTITVQILDRRWKWRFGNISGQYNTEGDFRFNARKTPQQLATLLLQAMGETGFEVADLPNTAIIPVDWDYDNPAVELASICDDLACRIVLGLDNKVRIRKIGEGMLLPDLQEKMSVGITISSSLKPDKLTVVSAPYRYQVRIVCEAVGEDRDGNIKPINDLPYAPNAEIGGDWTKVHPDAISDNSLSGGVTPEDVDLAIKTVYKWYRIKTVLQNTFLDGMTKNVNKMWQILPLYDIGAQTIQDEILIFVPRVAYVHAVYNSQNFGHKLVPKVTRQGFTLDKEKGLVIFQEPIYTVFNNKTIPAFVVLETSINVRDESTGAFIRVETSENLSPALITKQMVIKREDIEPKEIRFYTQLNSFPFTHEQVDVVKNSTQVSNASQHYIDGQKKEFEQVEDDQLKFAGIVKIEPDGAIQQVGWSVGSNGAETIASRNNENNLNIPSYAERRRIDDQVEQQQNRKTRLQSERRAANEARKMKLKTGR